ncbi:MAG TPA: segregation/condensation protein A [Oligoflexia bacterium]|nr:segregation/condensation protein A [Oligoflexia bacterium]HMP27135.1 segregation/condensation protein A [Oligoflexia bacterium]
MVQSDFFRIELDRFSGPIDLLLHLVKKNELPIEKLSLALVSKQYLEALNQLKDLDIDIAGEYLVIAATLLSIKSSLLLNKPVDLPTEDGSLADPAEELLLRVQMAERFRFLASEIGSRPQLGIDVFSGKRTIDRYGSPVYSYAPHDAQLIKSAFLKALSKYQKQSVSYTIQLEPISIADRMRFILDKLSKTKEQIDFLDLLEQSSLSELIASFLAILELSKQRLIYVSQVETEICIGLQENFQSVTELSSEFDQALGAIVGA